MNVDTSDVGLGASLTQMQNGVEVTVSCTLHTFSSTKWHYSALEKEALACLWAVERFEKFLLGKHFTLHTDQHTLRQLLTSPVKAESVRKANKYIHWAQHLSAYDFDISYHPGEENLVPDALTHLPLPTDSEAVNDYYTTHLICQIRSQGISAMRSEAAWRWTLCFQ